MSTQTQSLASLPEQLRVVAWPGPAVQPVGHRPDSPYVEAVWLEVLGSSATLAWRRVARIAAARPGTIIGSAELAQSLRLGRRFDKDASISRAVARMVAFGAAKRTEATLAVRTALPDVPCQQRQRPSVSAQLAHQYWGHRQPGLASAVPQPLSVEVGL
jgi:hypothetical protein